MNEILQPIHTSLNIRFPPNLAHKTKIEAARLNVSRSELIRLATREYLEKLEQKNAAADSR